MSEEKKEPWLNHLALATVFFAVGATLSTFKGGGYSTQSVINQAQASDQWAFYQAKSTKQQLNELAVDEFRLHLTSLPANSPAKAEYEKAIAEHLAEIERYKAEKKEIEAKARSLEEARDNARLHGWPFGMAVIFLQVAVLLNSIAGLMRVKRIWWCAIPVGLVGLTFFADGFFLFY